MGRADTALKSLLFGKNRKKLKSNTSDSFLFHGWIAYHWGYPQWDFGGNWLTRSSRKIGSKLVLSDGTFGFVIVFGARFADALTRP